MSTEKELKVQARLAAIEFVICDLSAICYRILGWNDEQIKQRHDGWVELARTVQLHDASAAEAGLISGELEDSISDLARLIRGHLGIASEER